MILEVKNLAFKYHNSRTIFENVNFSVSEGEILSILGVNGSGKSTLLNCLANLYSPMSGEIILEGNPISGMSLRDVARVIGYVPQTHNPAYAYTVLEFTVMGRTPHIALFSSPSSEDYAIARKALKRVHIEHLIDKAYTEISGGERQLVLIARVLAQQPKLILMDEPTSHLDYGNQFRTISLIKELAREGGFGIIMTTHNPDHAIILNDKVGILDNYGRLTVGRVCEELTDERLSNMYQIPIIKKYDEYAGRDICIVK